MGEPRRPYQRFCPNSRAGSVVFADRQRQVGEQSTENPAHSAGHRGCSSAPGAEILMSNSSIGRRTVGRLVERLAGRCDLSEICPWQDDRSHGCAIEQRKGARITRQGQCSVDVRSWRDGMTRSNGFVLPLTDWKMSAPHSHRQSLPVEARRNLGRVCGGRTRPWRASLRRLSTTRQPVHRTSVVFMRSPSFFITLGRQLSRLGITTMSWRHELSLVVSGG